MAVKKERKAGAAPYLIPIEPTLWEQTLDTVRQNALFIAVGVAIVFFSLLAGVWYRVSRAQAEEALLTAYAEALQIENPAERAQKLRSLAENADRWTPEILYMAASAALEARQPEAADGFRRILEQFPDSEYAPYAAEGIGFWAEVSHQPEEALKQYQSILSKYPDSFVARVQHYNIGRLYEQLGDFAAAKAAYEKQIEVFPDSKVAAKAKSALDNLKTAHPELFPPEVTPSEQTPSAESSPAAIEGNTAQDTTAQTTSGSKDSGSNSGQATADTQAPQGPSTTETGGATVPTDVQGNANTPQPEASTTASSQDNTTEPPTAEEGKKESPENEPK